MDVRNQSDKWSELRSIIEKTEKRVRYYETRVLHQTVFYLIYQLIILLSISNSFSCRNWWLPFSLSLICSLIFTITYSSTIHTYLRLQFQHDVNILQQELLRSRNASKADLESGSSDDHSVLVHDKFRMYKRRASAFSVAFCLAAFTCLVLYACHSIPCGN